MEFRTAVDREKLDLAKEEILSILQQCYVQRRIAARNSKRNRVIFYFAKTLGILCCIFLILVASTVLLIELNRNNFPVFYAVCLVIAVPALVFFLWWDLDKQFNTRIHALLRAAHKKFTQSSLKGAEAEVPYEALYTLEGSELAHFRNGQPAWTRQLPGYVRIGEHVALLFKKEFSYYPAIILMHDDGAAIAQGLSSCGVEVIRG